MNPVLLFAALIPPIILLIYVYAKDKTEKEPISLLCLLLFGGVLSGFASIFLEVLFEKIAMPVFGGSPDLYLVLQCFFGIALVEEGTKTLFLYLFGWKNKNFDYFYDGLLYAIYVSLGFAAFENVFYVMDGGMSTALMRAIMSIPGHMAFSVPTGLFFSRAKVHSLWGTPTGVRKCRFAGIFWATLLHGLYDLCCFTDVSWSWLILIALVIVLYIMSFRLIHIMSKGDFPLS